jgi:predicted dehydrogenase
VTPAAWVDSDEEARARAIEVLGLPKARVFGALDEALAEVEADAALAVVPLAAHAAVTRAALEAGLHVLVEKPFTETLAEAATLEALARARGRVLMVNQNYRWFPAPRLARELLRDGAIGELIACYLDFHFFYGQGYRYFFLEHPLLNDMAIHHFDSLRFILRDEPLEVSCQSIKEPHRDTPFAGYPAAVATIRFARGALASYRGSWVTRGPSTNYGGNWRLDGTRGTIEFTFRGPGEERETMDRLVLHRPGMAAETPAVPDVPGKDRKGALATFARWIEDGVPPEDASTAADNLRSLALMFAAIRSAERSGAAVRIDDVLSEVAR